MGVFLSMLTRRRLTPFYLVNETVFSGWSAALITHLQRDAPGWCRLDAIRGSGCQSPHHKDASADAKRCTKRCITRYTTLKMLSETRKRWAEMSRARSCLLLNLMRTTSRSFKQNFQFTYTKIFAGSHHNCTQPSHKIQHCRSQNQQSRTEVLTMKQPSRQSHAQLTLRCIQLARRWPNRERAYFRALTGLALFPNNTPHWEVHGLSARHVGGFASWHRPEISLGFTIWTTNFHSHPRNDGILRQLP